MNKVLILGAGLLFALFARAATEEIAEVTPSAPASQHYHSFYSSPELDFAIDLNSIAIQPSDDREVRYIIKAISKQGAVNVSYEGVRCAGHQKIIYAIGHSDGSWQPARSPKWVPIYKTGINLPQTSLAYDFFCDGNALSGDEQSIRRRIQANRSVRYP